MNRNSKRYVKMVYDAALQKLTFVADVTNVTINNPYEGTGWDFEFEWTGGIKFESSDTNVATINPAGHVEAVAPGQTVITVKNGNGALEKVVVAVRERPTEVKDFKLSIEHFDGLSPDGAIIVKIQDVTPADVLLGGTDGLMVSWFVKEDEATAE